MFEHMMGFAKPVNHQVGEGIFIVLVMSLSAVTTNPAGLRY
jgi:hypothetical protein